MPWGTGLGRGAPCDAVGLCAGPGSVMPIHGALCRASGHPAALWATMEGRGAPYNAVLHARASSRGALCNVMGAVPRCGASCNAMRLCASPWGTVQCHGARCWAVGHHAMPCSMSGLHPTGHCAMLWGTVQHHGAPCWAVGLHEMPRSTIKCHVLCQGFIPRGTVQCHGHCATLQSIVQCHGAPCPSVGHHDGLWGSVPVHGAPCWAVGLRARLWGTAQCHGTPCPCRAFAVPGRTSKVPALSRVTWSCWERAWKPGMCLANSTTSRTAGVKLSEKSSQISCTERPLRPGGWLFMGQACG